MTIFYGARDDMDIAEPRPYWLAVKRALAIVLGIVCGAEFAVFVWLAVGD